jgi:hypothetical protein
VSLRLEDFINLVSQLNSQPPPRDPGKMLAELLDRVERYSVSPDGYKVPLEIRYKNRTRRLYVVVSVDREKQLILIDWRYLKPEDHELLKRKAYEEKRKIEKKSIEKYIRIYFKLKR